MAPLSHSDSSAPERPSKAGGGGWGESVDEVGGTSAGETSETGEAEVGGDVVRLPVMVGMTTEEMLLRNCC